MMKTLNKLSFLMAAMAVIALISCGSEDKTDPKPDNTVKIPKDTGERVSKVVEIVTKADNTSKTTTYKYTYDDENRVISKSGGSDEVTYEYEPSKIIRTEGNEKSVIRLGTRGEITEKEDTKDGEVEFNSTFVYDGDLLIKVKFTNKVSGNKVSELVHDREQISEITAYKCDESDKCNIVNNKIEYQYDDEKIGILFVDVLENFINSFGVIVTAKKKLIVEEKHYVVSATELSNTVKYTYIMDDEKRVTEQTAVTRDSSGNLLTTVVRKYTWK